MTKRWTDMASLIDRREFIFGGTLAIGLATANAAALARADQHPIDAFILDAMKKAKIPGMAVGYAIAGKVRFARGYGFANLEQRRVVTADTVFPIASITKTVTALAVMRLVEAKKMLLDDPVAAYLDFPVVNPRYPNDPITFRHLLTHTSSISDKKYYEVDTRVFGHDATIRLRDHLLAFLVPGGKYYSPDDCYSQLKPGVSWDYSNTGFALLGYLVGRIGGEDGRKQIARHVFSPLSMHHTYWTLADIPGASRSTPYDFVDGLAKAVPPIGLIDWPAGAIRSSIADFIKLVAAFANGGVFSDVRVLSEAGAHEMLRITQPAGLPEWTQGQGLGWGASRLGASIYPEHWGGSTGIFTAAYLNPSARAGALILTNASATPEGKTAVKAIAQYLMEL
jgi:CubicO group peptidase (beta-lactamase class C family)